MQSWLSIAADESDRLAKAPQTGADAIVVDLANIPGDESAEALRSGIAAWLTRFADPAAAERPFARWVQVKPMDAPLWRNDLVAVMAGAPDGVVVPRVTGPDDLRRLAAELYEIEQSLGLKHNSTKIMPRIGETARAVLSLERLSDDPQPRLTAFTWNAVALAKAIGARRTHDAQGQWCGVPAQVRSTTILLARAMGVVALETAADAALDDEAIVDHANAARQDGFGGMFATSARQIAAINAAYAMPNAERDAAETELRAAKRAFIGRTGPTLTETDEPVAVRDTPGTAQPFVHAASETRRMRVIG